MRRLAIDVDGVCADFSTACNEWLAADLHKPLAPVDRWDWYLNYPFGEKAWRHFWDFVHEDPEWFGTLDPIEGAAETLRTLYAAGHRVTFLTARHPKFTSVTADWLTKHGFSGNLLMRRDKWETDFDTYLDDSMDNIEKLEEAGKDAVVFLQPWNSRGYWDHVTADTSRSTPAVVDWQQFAWLLGVDVGE